MCAGGNGLRKDERSKRFLFSQSSKIFVSFSMGVKRFLSFHSQARSKKIYCHKSRKSAYSKLLFSTTKQLPKSLRFKEFYIIETLASKLRRNTTNDEKFIVTIAWKRRAAAL